MTNTVNVIPGSLLDEIYVLRHPFKNKLAYLWYKEQLYDEPLERVWIMYTQGSASLKAYVESDPVLMHMCHKYELDNHVS